MTLLSRGPEAEIGLPPLDMHAAGTIGTATFSLG